jgi:hypothetical protein
MQTIFEREFRREKNLEEGQHSGRQKTDADDAATGGLGGEVPQISGRRPRGV